MISFLSEVATKLADQWLKVLVMPGVLWLSVLAIAAHLGQAHPFDVGRLHAWLGALAANPGSHALATVLLAAVGLLAAAAGISMAAAALGALLQRAYVATGRRRPLAWLTKLRQRRWDRATARLRTAIGIAASPAVQGYDADRAAARVRVAENRRSALGASRPQWPTRIGELFHSVAVRAKSGYGLDLDLAWPRLWTVLPKGLRADLAASGERYGASARLTAWGVLYALLVVFWWPAIILGAVLVGYGWMQSCVAAKILSDHINTAVDLHTGDLAGKLGISAAKPLVPATGDAIMRLLRKD